MKPNDELYENKEKNKVNVAEESLQYNRQDLDQEQKVDVNPVQLNTQKLHVSVNNEKKDYSGKITGITFLERNKKILPNVEILLYFGNECKYPIYKTNSDENGNFVIEDIPSGYYTMSAQLGVMKCEVYSIKVLPGQNVHQSILLK